MTISISRTLCLAAASVFLGGCPGDDEAVDIDSLTDGSTGSSTSTVTTGLDETGAAESSSSGSDSSSGTGEPPAVGLCDSVSIPSPGAFAVVVEQLVSLDIDDELAAAAAANTTFFCDQAGLIDSTASTDAIRLALDDVVSILVYRPDDAGSWPAGPLPAVILMPGNNQFIFAPDAGYADGDAVAAADRFYDHVIEPLVARGFVVFAVQPTGTSATEEKRAATLLCAGIWAQNAAGWAEAGNDRLDDTLTLMGHSRGGGAVYYTTSVFDDFQAAIGEMAEFELCSTVAIAPRWNTSEVAAVNEPVVGGDSVPYFVLSGAPDEDTKGQSVSAYDAFVLEDEIDAGDPLTLGQHDKLIAWVYGVRHNAWGGVPNSQNVQGGTIAHTVGPELISTFLGWQLTSSFAEAERQVFERLADPLATSTGIAAVDASSLWTDPEFDNPLLYGQYGKPLIYVGLSDGARPLDRTPDGRPDRLVVDTLARRATGGVIADLGNGAGQSNDFLSPGPDDLVTNTSSVDIMGLSLSDVWQGSAESVTGLELDELDFDRHQTRLLRVDWDDSVGQAGATITWNTVDLDVSDFSYLSLRLGSVLDRNPTGPGDSCFRDSDAPTTLDVELLFEDDDAQVTAAVDSSGTLLQQQIATAIVTSQGDNCSATQFMHTARVPLSRFCQDLQTSTERLVGVRLRFPAPPTGEVRRLLIDSLEFTRDPLDPEEAVCGQGEGLWACAATSSLLVEETSCAAEPTPVCAVGDMATASVPVPTVVLPNTQPFSGWLTHVPAGWVEDPANPTSGELAAIEGRCARACDLEWSDDPDVVANCFSGGAFATPTLLSETSVGPTHAIPDAQLDGSGIFAGQSLGCDLNSTCCESFDENLCAASPARVTPGPSALGRGEQHVLKLQGSGKTQVSFITPGTTTTKNMHGEVGFSPCVDGDTGQTCPFYLGSFGVWRNDTWSHADTCPDGSALDVEISDLDLSLVQPAFGIANSQNYEKGMPPGSLQMIATFHADGVPITVRGANRESVIFEAGAFKFTASDVDVEFDLPCGNGTLPLTVRFDVQYTGVVSSPPNLMSITTPGTVQCGTLVPLTANVTDPNGDLLPLRWYVDDVLLEVGVSSLAITQGHELRVVARDSRGAAKTKTRSINCW